MCQSNNIEFDTDIKIAFFIVFFYEFNVNSKFNQITVVFNYIKHKNLIKFKIKQFFSPNFSTKYLI